MDRILERADSFFSARLLFYVYGIIYGFMEICKCDMINECIVTVINFNIMKLLVLYLKTIIKILVYWLF